VAKILVADDNSNIQKMVGLALKDQGIDVVAVGNGEAAVRKISDIRPDLVLADVFMPVRNGYEVCQHVKSDESLAHIPVILLVGAFDPLDEQEAQRVGADGVLKKPFVPPDPLISMVKSALARAGVQVGGAPPPQPKQEEPIRIAEMLAPRIAPPVQDVPNAAAFGSVPEIPSAENESMHDGTPGMPEPVRIAAGSGPLAFGNLLDTSETEQEEDLVYATTARPELERDWKSGDEEEEDEVVEEEEEKQSASWRRDGGDEAMENEEAGSGAAKDWRETAFAEAPARRMKHDSWSPQKEVSKFEEAAETEQSVGAMLKEPPMTETRMAPAAAAPFTEDAWAAALKPKNGVETATAEEPAVAETARIEQAAPAADKGPSAYSAEPVEEVQEAKKPAPESSWFSAVSSPWDEEVQKANRLASTWDAPTTSEPATNAVPDVTVPAVEEHEGAAPEVPTAAVDTLSAGLGDELKTKMQEAALPPATVEAIREEAQQVTEAAVQQAPASESTARAAEPSMEDLVAKVLAKMNPDMLQAVTRDILKNVVESMVKDELNAKK